MTTKHPAQPTPYDAEIAQLSTTCSRHGHSNECPLDCEEQPSPRLGVLIERRIGFWKAKAEDLDKKGEAQPETR